MANTIEQDKTIRKVKEMRADGVAGSPELFDRMMKSDDFRTGNQWDPAIKESMRLKGKFTLTVPLIKPKIKHLAGTEIANPRQIKVSNTRNGTDTIAQLLTSLAKQVFDAEKMQFENSECFEEGIAIGQSATIAMKDKTEDPKHANIKIEKAIGQELLFDPTCLKYNINHRDGGCKYVIWEPWVDKELVKADYPDKKEELDSMGHSTRGEGIIFGVVSSVIDWMTNRRLKSSTPFGHSIRTDTDVLTKTRFQKSHTWWREPKTCLWWFDKRETEMDAKLIMEDEQIAEVRKQTKENPEVFEIEEVICNVMHHTIRVGDVFLEDRINEWNSLLFPVFPYWPFFENGNKGSLTEDLIGTQEEINWLHSQSLNLIKKIASTGLVINSDPFGNYKDILEANAGEDGFVFEKDKAGGDIKQWDPPKIPVSSIALEQNAQVNLDKISNVRTESPNTDKDRVASTVALKQQSSLTGNATVFRNWDWTISMQADFIIEVIRNNDIFSEDEIREIVDREDLIDRELMATATQIVTQQFEEQGITLEPPQQVDELALQAASPEAQQVIINQAQEDLELFDEQQRAIQSIAVPMAEAMLLDSIQDMRRGKYSTKIGLSPLSDTMRLIKSVELFELHKLLIEGGDVGLDGEDLIDGTGVDNKDKIKEGRRRKMQAIQQSEANVNISRSA